MKVCVTLKAFGDKVVLKDLFLDINEGKTTFIEGRSGVGKTTLLRIISLLDRDYEGSIDSPFCLISILFQEDRLVENISVMANLRAVTGDRVKISRMLSELGLKGEEETLIKDLSGGMKRRVSIIRALLIDYDALILDEPFSGLDGETKRRVSEFILRENRGRTIIAVSHESEDYDLLKGNYKIVLGGENE